jgi:hypothetical protein
MIFLLIIVNKFTKKACMKKLCIALSLFVLAGCASPRKITYQPSAEELANADYGMYPSNYEEKIKNYMQTALKDPESARYRYLMGPYKDTNHADKKRDLIFLYRVKVFINAKNSYGGYVGEEEYFCDFLKGEVLYCHNLTQSIRSFDRAMGR